MDDFLLRCREDISKITVDQYETIIQRIRTLLEAEYVELDHIQQTAKDRIIPKAKVVLVVPALIGVQDQIVLFRKDLHGLLQHRRHHQQVRALRQGIGYHIAAAQIHNRGQIQLLSEQAELCDVRCPLLVRLLSMEVTIQQIVCYLAHFTLVRTVFLHPDTADKTQFLHQSLHSLVVDGEILVVKLVRDAPVAIPSLVFVEYLGDLCLDIGVLILAHHAFCMIIEGCSWQLSDLQQHIQWEFLPQFLDHRYFFFWCRSLSCTKACNFLGMRSLL